MSQENIDNTEKILQTKEEYQLEEELFQRLTSEMELEVLNMPNVATRRGILQKIASTSVVVPAAILLMATGTQNAEGCGEGCTIPCRNCITDCCFFCQNCITDTCWLWIDEACPGCLNCVDQGRVGCGAGRNDHV
jgi:hypothetical protein